MPNIRLIVEYNGSNFNGWQYQPGLRTIQSELQSKLEICLRTPVTALQAAGRTDAGVHARRQVVSFRVETTPDLKRMAQSISSLLRPELAVISADFVPDNFRPVQGVSRKQYTYTILHRPAPAVLDYGQCWHLSGPLDIRMMQNEARVLLGVHDFTSFRAAGCSNPVTTKELFVSELTWNPPYLVYRVVAKGFLKQMIRNIVGTLVDMGQGKLPPNSISEILAAKNRQIAGVTAPAHGLCLDWVEYEQDIPSIDLVP